VDFPGGSAEKLKESIERISSLDIEYLLPGHMDYITGARDVKKNFDLIRQYVFSML
jgi:glyoxylase-like metal-dependent hydrolase (beta-lactamase superfamily II)